MSNGRRASVRLAAGMCRLALAAGQERAPEQVQAQAQAQAQAPVQAECFFWWEENSPEASARLEVARRLRSRHGGRRHTPWLTRPVHPCRRSERFGETSLDSFARRW
jgi:hypothetical protein